MRQSREKWESEGNGHWKEEWDILGSVDTAA